MKSKDFPSFKQASELLLQAVLDVKPSANQAAPLQILVEVAARLAIYSYQEKDYIFSDN